MEYLDVYNEYGEIINTLDRDTIHDNHLLHRTVHVWIIDSNNNILIQHRNPNKKIFPNMWDVSFAGHIESKESSIDTVIREGKEELGIEVDLNKLYYIGSVNENMLYKNTKNNEISDIYVLKEDILLKDIVLQEEEVDDIKYVDKDTFFNMLEELTPHRMEYLMLKEIL